MKYLKLSPDDPRLTAYALNELQGEERVAIEAALAHDPEARAYVERTRAFTQQLEAALANEPEVDLVPRMDVFAAPDETDVSAAASSVAETIAPEPPEAMPAYAGGRSKYLRFPQLYFLIGGIAAAGFAVAVALHKSPVYVTNYYEVDLRPRTAATASQPIAKVEAPANPPPVASAPATDLPVNSATTSVQPSSSAPAPANAANVAAATPSNASPTGTAVAVPATDKPAVSNSVATAETAPAAPTATLAAVPAATANVGPSPATAPEPKPNVVTPPSEAVATHRNDGPASSPADLATNEHPADAVPLSPYEVTPTISAPKVPIPVSKPVPAYAGSFVSAPASPVAGFAIPIDTGSFDAIRGAIAVGHLPRPETVKIEELLNHDIAPPKLPVVAPPAGGSDAPVITAVVEGGEAPWAPTHRLVRIGLKAAGARSANGNRVVAKDIRVEVEFNPRRVAMYRLIGYERTSSATSRRVSSAWTDGTIEAGRVVTALFEIVLTRPETDSYSAGEGTYSTGHLVTEERPRPAAQMLTLHVQYRQPDSGSRGKVKVAYVDTGNTFAATSDDFKFAAGVAAYGMILRDSPHRGKATLDNAIAWASAGVAKPGDDDTGQRGEIIDLMRRTKALLH